MCKHKQTLSFSFVMKPGLLLFFCILTIKTLAQDKYIEGIVFDADSKDRMAIVHIVNNTTGATIYNNLNGEFKIEAKPGDMLIFDKSEYHPDTIHVANTNALAVYMKRTSIQLREVTIYDSLHNPKTRLASNKALYNRAYSPTANADLLSIGSGGVGLSVDAIYNAFSRSGHDARRLREAIEGEYKQDFIDYRFNKNFVGKITGLKEKQLEDFMLKYRPGYYFITYASDYEFIASIRTNLKRYYRNPDAYALTPLGESKIR
jgi:hypothetical protein